MSHTVAHEHAIRLRDLRTRFGEPESWVAECTCGWHGQTHGGLHPDRAASRDGMRHCDDARSAAVAPGRDYYRRA